MPSAVRAGQKIRSLPPWGVKLGPDEDRLIKKAGKAEQELESAIDQGKWNELAPKARLWLLRAFAVDHSQWAEFTPRCQMWVLHELGRLLAEERQEIPPKETYKDALTAQTIMKDRTHLLAALEKTRLPRIVKADPKRARDLAVICEESLALTKAVNLLEVELANQEAQRQRRLIAERSSSPRAPTPSLPRSRSDTNLRGERTLLPPGKSKAAHGGDRRTMQKSASEASLGRRKVQSMPSNQKLPPADAQLAPLAPAGSKAMQPGERERAKSILVTQTSVGNVGGAAEAAAAVASDPRTGAAQKSKPPDPDAPRLLFMEERGADAHPDPESGIEFRTCFSLLPKKSSAWRKLVEEEERQRVKVAMLRKTLEHVRARRERLDNAPAASVMVLIPPERHVAIMNKEMAQHGIDPVERQRMEDEKGKQKVTYELRIPSLVSVHFVQEALAQAYKNVKDWDISPKWALEIVQAELELAFPMYDFPIEDLQNIGFLAIESASNYQFDWEGVKRTEPKEEMEKLLRVSSSKVFDGILLSIQEGASRKWREDPPTHAADVLPDLMEDAARAHQQLKQFLGPGTEWASLALHDLDEVPEDDESRTWRAEGKQQNGLVAQGLVPGGSCFDPGILGESLVVAKAKGLQQPYEAELPLQEVGAISRVDITFENFHFLNIALGRLLNHFEVVWIDNKFRDPSSMGSRCISLGVRLQVPVGDVTIEVPPPAPEPAAIANVSAGGLDDREDGDARGSEDADNDADGEREKHSEEAADADVGSGLGDGDDAPAAKAEESSQPQAVPAWTGPCRAHIAEIRLMHEKLREAENGSRAQLVAISERLVDTFGIAPADLDVVQDLIVSLLDVTDGRLPSRAALELDRLIRHVRRIATDLPEHDAMMAAEIVAETATQALAVGAAERAGAPASVEDAIQLVSIPEEEANRIDAARRRKAKQEEAKKKE